MLKPIMCWRHKARRFIFAFALVILVACGGDTWHGTDITGLMPSLQFTMTRAGDGREVTQADYRGDIVLLYFGYTFCPDRCPMALMYVGDMLKALGPGARHIRFLFVTVDPKRDTTVQLNNYLRNFSPQIEGLRGTPDELAKLARRYRAVYSVKPETKDHPYEVTHGSAIYIFDATGAARLLVSSTRFDTEGIKGTVEDLRRLLTEKQTFPAAGRR